jgi:hypothetical protein
MNWIKLLVVAVVICSAGYAGAQAKGLFAENSTTVDGVKVRRIRDREENVVCYLATERGDGAYQKYPRPPAISCVQVVVVNP